MTIYKKISTCIFISFLFFSLGSCEKLEDLNTNPNRPETAPMSSLLPKIEKELADFLVEEAFLIGNNAAQLTAKSLRVEVDIYNWAGLNIWDKSYTILKDIEELREVAKKNNNLAYQGVANILRSYLFSILTDMYGDIPYSEAIKGKTLGITRPKYDSQDSIYLGQKGLLQTLEKTNILLSNTKDKIDGDILYNGDLNKWRKFGNSLCLRLLLRISHKVNISSMFANVLSNPNNIMSSNDDNAIVQYLDVFPNKNPILDLKRGDFDAVRIGENLVKVLSISQDPRLAVYARPTDSTIFSSIDSAVYLGWANGANGCDFTGCRLGLAYYNYPQHPMQLKKADAIFMTYSEVEFLIAEALIRNFISGNPEPHYKSGIESSMDYYDIDFSLFGWTDFNDFYTNGTQHIAYKGHLHQIWRQKWIALFFNGLEPYIEVRRWLQYNNNDWSALPFLSPPCNNVNNDFLPVRFPYPIEEQTLNYDNYIVAVGKLGGNSTNHKMWLLE